MYSLRKSRNGLFIIEEAEDPRQENLGDGNTTIQEQDIIGLEDYAVLRRPTSVFYYQQEDSIDEYGEPVSLKRGGRVMLALKSGADGQSVRDAVVVDFAVGKDGMLTQTSDTVESTPPSVYSPALVFDAPNRSYVQTENSFSLTNNNHYTFQAWLKPDFSYDGDMMPVFGIELCQHINVYLKYNEDEGFWSTYYSCLLYTSPSPRDRG